ncbi:hypothetical protein WME76_44565 (plasmid) [Sorangium sp. So ce119]|uniref:hypothetical protein n=1 Tax=Sorangium sp. So ce119 TaxID=3133279 RepID=UPI003F5DAC99
MVRAPGGGAGRAVSTPLDIDCTSLCSAAFPTRSEVFLLASSAGHDVAFTGCDSVLGNACFVTMMGARSVTVKFVPNNPSGCRSSCLDLCQEDGQLTPGRRAPSCNAERL